MKRTLLFGVAPAALAVAAAGCGGSSAPTASVAPAGYGASQATTSTAAPTVGTRHTKLGTVLVDGRGRTLYLFEKDKGPATTCSGACASVWPPLTSAGKPKAGRGVTAAKLGTTKSGKAVVMYAGHPLYTYVGDKKAGDVKGQGLDQFGAEWYVVAPNGRKIDDDDE
jgi:predicted lipoprotein with Yx(FWY)xxD motif